jgi:hypothetical protein
LTLLVAWIAANHVEPPVTPDQLAVLTDTLDAGANLHGTRSFPLKERGIMEKDIVVSSGEATREKIAEHAPATPLKCGVTAGGIALLLPEITEPLEAIGHGEPHVAAALSPLVHEELRCLAGHKRVEKPHR